MDIQHRIEGDVFFVTDTVVDWVDIFTLFGVGLLTQVFGEVSKLRRAKRKAPAFHISKRESDLLYKAKPCY